MPRAKGGVKSRRRHKKVLKAARGYLGGRSKLYRTAQEAVDKGLDYAFAHRRLKKRDFRSLWQIRIGAAAREQGLSYSLFMSGLKKAGILLNRKILSEIAIHRPVDFGAIVAIAKEQVTSAQAA